MPAPSRRPPLFRSAAPSWAMALLLLGLGGCAEEGGRKPCAADEERAADGLCYPLGDSGAPAAGTINLALVQTLAPMDGPPASPTNALANSAAAALLGQRLFFDPALSPGGDQSCASCHDPDHDLAGTVVDHEGPLPRIAPPLVGSAWREWWGWTGACDSAWCAAATALEAPGQLDGDRLSLARHIAEDETLKAEYEAIFGALPDTTGLPDRARPAGTGSEDWAALDADTQQALSAVLANVGKATEAWLRTLQPGASDLDRYVDALSRGDTTGGGALSDRALRGLTIFADEQGCLACHQGPMLMGGFANVGLGAGPGPAEEGRPAGLAAVLASEFNGAGAWSDDPETGAARLAEAEAAGATLGATRVPALRTSGRTAPYAHDGRFATLGEVLAFYSALSETPETGTREPSMTPLAATDDDLADLAAFLEAAAGAPVDPALLQAP